MKIFYIVYPACKYPLSVYSTEHVTGRLYYISLAGFSPLALLINSLFDPLRVSFTGTVHSVPIVFLY